MRGIRPLPNLEMIPWRSDRSTVGMSSRLRSSTSKRQDFCTDEFNGRDTARKGGATFSHSTEYIVGRRALWSLASRPSVRYPIDPANDFTRNIQHRCRQRNRLARSSEGIWRVRGLAFRANLDRNRPPACALGRSAFHRLRTIERLPIWSQRPRAESPLPSAASPPREQR